MPHFTLLLARDTFRKLGDAQEIAHTLVEKRYRWLKSQHVIAGTATMPPLMHRRCTNPLRKSALREQR